MALDGPIHRIGPLLLVVVLVLGLGGALAAQPRPAPLASAPEEAGPMTALAAPTIGACSFRPDPDVATWKLCSEDNSDVPIPLNVTVQFNVTVSDPDGGNITVALYFDHVSLNETGNRTLSPPSLLVNATLAGPNATTIYANWSYDRLHPDFPLVAGQSSSYYVFFEVLDNASENSTWPYPDPDGFTVVVANTPPTLEACAFRPDPRVPTIVPCDATGAPPVNPDLPLYVNVTMEFYVNVSDRNGHDLSIVIYYSYIYFVRDENGNVTGIGFNPPSAVLNVTTDGPNTTVLQANWSYDRLNPDFPIDGQSSNYWVFVEVRDSQNASSTWPYPTFPFGVPIGVKKNSPPFVNRLSSSYQVDTLLTFPNPEVPPFNVTVELLDADSDNLTITWFWGDGSYTVYFVPVTNGSANLTASHLYPLDAFPLNETSRPVEFPMTIWADDTVPGHNETQSSAAIFTQDYDWFPTAVFIRKPALGSVWKVGDTIDLDGFAFDLEGDPLTYYWDTDISVDSPVDGDLDPGNDRDLLGPTGTATYAAPGNYSVRLWASDGEDKKFCNNDDCSDYLTHWRNQTYGIQVKTNARPRVVAAPEYVVEANKPAILWIEVQDDDGDGMTVTWDWGDGTPLETTQVPGNRKPGWPINSTVQDIAYVSIPVNGTHVFRTLNYTRVNITVSDGNLTDAVSTSAFVWSVNAAPRVLSFATYRANNSLIQNNRVLIREDFYLDVNLTDGDTIDGGVLDDLHVTIDWADGTSNSTDISSVAGTYPTIRFMHNYSTGGEFLIRIKVTDGLAYLRRDGDTPENYTYDERSHNVTQAGPTMNVPRAYAYRGVGPWDWWDDVTLALVLGIPGFFSVRAAWRYRQERRREEEA